MSENKKRRTLVEDRWKEISRQKGRSRFSLPDIRQRHVWDELDEELKARLVNQGEAVRKEPWPMILLSDYREFSRNGNRESFEDKYFGRRKKLTSLVMAECVENQGRFVDEILNGIYLLLEETGWCLPAHNSYIRDAGQLPIQDRARPIIDLFAAETGEILALTEYLLRPLLQEVSPFVTEYVKQELRRRILTPYLSHHFWWMGNGLESMCNWTPWITQNVLLTILTREEEELSREEYDRVMDQAVRSLDYFLDEYEEDGGCDEGAQYYSHAALCFYGALRLIDRAAEGGMDPVFSHPLIRNMASYIIKMYVGGDYYVNFADCSPCAGRRGIREFLFARAVGDHSMAAFAAEDYRRSDWSQRLMTGRQNLYDRLLQALYHKEIMDHQGEKKNPEDAWFESVGLMIARDGVYTLAAKAGCNGDSHNHNDVGSLTLYKEAQPLLIDLGVETYTAKTFSPDRYDIWTMQSQYHNLPSFGVRGGFVQQKPGEEYRAKEVVCLLGEDGCSLSMDISAAYGDERIRAYTRQIRLVKNSHVEVRDSYEGDLPCVLSFMTYERPVLLKRDTEKVCIGVGALGELAVEGAGDLEIETCPITDARLGIAWKHDCYRILIHMEDRSLNLRIR